MCAHCMGGRQRTALRNPFSPSFHAYKGSGIKLGVLASSHIKYFCLDLMHCITGPSPILYIFFLKF